MTRLSVWTFLAAKDNAIDNWWHLQGELETDYSLGRRKELRTKQKRLERQEIKFQDALKKAIAELEAKAARYDAQGEGR